MSLSEVQQEDSIFLLLVPDVSALPVKDQSNQVFVFRFIYRVKAFNWFARMMSSGDGVSNSNGIIGDTGIDDFWCSLPRSSRSLAMGNGMGIFPSRIFFLLLCSLWLLNERAHAKTDGLAKMEGVQENDDIALLK